MLGIVVWTIKDIIGMVLIGVFVLCVIIAIITVAIYDWKKKRRQRKE